MENSLYQDELPGGKHWSFIVRRNMILRLIDKEGGANVGMLLYNPENMLERYNAPDTLKCQHSFKLTQGHCLYSDMGRIFCSVIADTHGWHDTVAGNSTAAMVRERWGHKSYQQHRNDWTQNGQDAFLVELAKYELGRRDLAANVNWFSKVVVDSTGAMALDPGAAKAGAYVDLRFEMDTLVVLHTCPHPLNEAKAWPAKPVVYQLRPALPLGDQDPRRDARDENRRGFTNNWLYHLGADESTSFGGRR